MQHWRANAQSCLGYVAALRKEGFPRDRRCAAFAMCLSDVLGQTRGRTVGRIPGQVKSAQESQGTFASPRTSPKQKQSVGQQRPAQDVDLSQCIAAREGEGSSMPHLAMDPAHAHNFHRAPAPSSRSPSLARFASPLSSRSLFSLARSLARCAVVVARFLALGNGSFAASAASLAG